MAQTPKDIKIEIKPVMDPEAAAQLMASIAAIGESFAKVGEQMKPVWEKFSEQLAAMKPAPLQADYALQPGITPAQIADAYGVPLELVAPDFADGVNQAIFDGSLTGELYATKDTGLVPLDKCPSNTSPYITGTGPSVLGANSFLVHKTATEKTWDKLSAEEILETIKKTAEKMKAKGVKPTHIAGPGQVKIGKLDAEGNPTGEWAELGSTLDGFTVQYAIPDEAPSFAMQMAEQQLKAEMDIEKTILGDFIGVDLSPGSGNTVIVQTNAADAFGTVQVSVYGPEKEPVKQVTLSPSDVEKLVENFPPPMSPSPSWHHDHTAPVAKLSNHSVGMAIDINANTIVASGGLIAPDTMHFESEAPLHKAFPEISVKKGGISFTTAMAAEEMPEIWYGEDGQEIVSTAADELTDADLVAANRVWCSWHDKHWADPAHNLGEVFECGSGTHTRPSTPLEDKQVLSRREMLRATGLL